MSLISNLLQGCSSPLVVKLADTQRDKEQRRLQQQLVQQIQQLNNASTWGNLAGLGTLSPQYLAVGIARVSLSLLLQINCTFLAYVDCVSVKLSRRERCVLQLKNNSLWSRRSFKNWNVALQCVLKCKETVGGARPLLFVATVLCNGGGGSADSAAFYWNCLGLLLSHRINLKFMVQQWT